jgi:polyisoprenyl-phosphate glycosyltransferase
MTDTNPQIVCIIPAYNEEKTVCEVAMLAADHHLLSRVIVVDDGSTDSTAELAQRLKGVEVLKSDKNRGKGSAMRMGMDSTKEPIILFLDADLVGLNHQHITDLLEPVTSGEVDMTVGLFRGGRLVTDLAHMVSPSLSGQRGVKRSVIENLDMDTVGFGIERALTDLWESGTIKVKDIILHGVTHLTKEEKRGLKEGVRQRIIMFRDIIKFETGKLVRKVAGEPNPKK